MSRFLLPAKLLFVLLAGFVGWQAWIFFRPAPRAYTEREVEAIRGLASEAADRIARVALAAGAQGSARDSGEPCVFGVAHFINDPTDRFTAIMAETIDARDSWRVDEASVIQRFLADVSTAVKQATSLDEVVHAGRRVGLDMLVAGKVLHVESDGSSALAEAQVVAYDLRQGKTVCNETLSVQRRASFGNRCAGTVTRIHPSIRFLVWLGLVLALPVVTPFATHWAIEKKRNSASFGLLAAYTLVDLFLALLFAGFRVGGALWAATLCLALALCCGYNYWVCGKIANTG